MNESTLGQIMTWIQDAMSGWRFAALALFVLIFFEILLIAFLAIPPTESGIGLFARDFRTWCFNYDPATGQMDWFYVTVMLAQPMILAGLILLIWSEQLMEAWRSVRSEMALVAGIALLAVGLVGLTFAFLNDGQETDAFYPFPAERLRVAIESPQFELEDHTGESLTLEELQGRVVLVTAIYASCGASCPIILTELRRVTEQLSDEDREDLVVLGITLDPENDGAEELTALAERHRVEAPLYRLLHGDSVEVNRVLDEFSFARVPDEERGEIDHANLFVLIDRQGKIAYRLTLNDRTENWLLTALGALLSEGRVSGGHVADRGGND